MLIFWIFFLFVIETFSHGHSQSRIIIDAGSTSSRVYLFTFEINQPEEFQMYKLGSVRPGLATYVGNMGSFWSLLQEKLFRAQRYVALDSMVDVFLYATGGVRKLPLEQQKEIIKDLKEVFLTSQRWNLVEAKTISGNEEAWYTLIGVNFVNKESTQPVGILDLGGASTQIVIPNGHVDFCGKPDSKVQTFSFQGYGGEHFREEYLKNLIDQKIFQSSCIQVGAFLEFNHIKIKGIGNGRECQKELSKYLHEKRKLCTTNTEGISLNCPPIDLKFKGIENFKFYGVSLYFYIYRFLKSFGKYDSNVKDLMRASEHICGTPYQNMDLEKLTKDGTTPHYKVPHRCFEINYLTVLLRDIYGFPDDTKNLHFVNKLDGKYLEWPTGAFVTQMCHLWDEKLKKTEL